MLKRCFDGLQILYKGYSDNETYIKGVQAKEYLIREEIFYDISEGNIGCIATKKIGNVIEKMFVMFKINIT